MVHRPYTGNIYHQTQVWAKTYLGNLLYTSSSHEVSNALGAKLGNATFACVKPSGQS